MVECVSQLIATRHRFETEHLFQRGQQRSVIVDRMIDCAARDQRRNNQRRHSNAELGKVEPVMVVLRVGHFVTRTDRWRRRHVIVEATVFVVGNHQNAFVPVR